jgi:hypothetical protein
MAKTKKTTKKKIKKSDEAPKTKRIAKMMKGKKKDNPGYGMEKKMGY